MDEAGEPLSRDAGVRRHASARQRFRPARPVLDVLTDDLGRYRIFGLEAGTYLVGADGRGGVTFFEPTGGRAFSSVTVQQELEPFITTFHPSARSDSEGQRIRLAAQDVTGIDITLQRARRLQLSGILLDSRGARSIDQPHAGAQTWTRRVR